MNWQQEPEKGQHKKTSRDRRAGFKRDGIYKASGRGGVQKGSSRGRYQGGDLGSKDAGDLRDYGAFEDTEEFFYEDEDEESTVELNPEATEFTPGCGPGSFKPAWRKDEPDDEGGLGAADWVSGGGSDDNLSYIDERFGQGFDA